MTLLNTINTHPEKLLKLPIKKLSVKLVNGNSIFSILIHNNRYDIIKKLIKKNKDLIKITNSNGNNVLHELGKYSNLNIFINILKINPSGLLTQNNDGEIPLFYIFHSPSTVKKVIDIVKKNSINIDILNYNNISPLSYCLLNSNKINDNYYKSSIILIQSKLFDINSYSEYLPVNIAIQKEYLEILKLLHKNGADFNKLNNNYISSTNIAIESTLNKEIKKFIISKSSGINNGPEGDNNPLINSIQNGDYETAEILINKGADVNFRNRFIETPLHVILNSNATKNIFKKAISMGDLNIQNIDGVTPLHILTKRNIWKEYSHLLENKKLDIFIKDSKGKSPFSHIKDKDLTEFTNIVVKSYINNSNSKKFKNYCSKNKCFDDIFKKIVQTRTSFPQENHYFNTSNFKLINKKPINNTSFNADTLHNLIYNIIILKKYSNVLPVFKFFIENKKITEEYENNNMYSDNNKIIYGLVNNYRYFLYEISPYIIVWKNIDCYYIDNNINIYIRKLMLAKSIRFIFFKLTLVVNSRSSHANIIIYDKKNNSMERFDPYGNIPYLDIDKLDNILENKFKYIFSKYSDKPKFNYYAPKDYMNIAYQTISNDSNINVRKINDPSGYCLAWTMWYLELRVNNPDIHPKALVEKSIKEINSSSDSRPDMKFIDFIRNYANYLDKEKNKFLSSINITKKNHYNKIFSVTDENKIIRQLGNIFNKITSTI